MAQNYTRQSSFDDGDTITASLFNNEFNQIVNALAYSASSDSSTGHKHDGNSGQGGNIPQIGDIDFLNKIVVDGTNNRWGFFVQVGGVSVEQIRVQDGAIVPVTDSDIDLGTSSLEFKDLFLDGTAHIDTLDVDADATVAGTLGVTGNTTVGGTLGVTGVLTGTSLDISGDLDVDGTTNLDAVDIDGAVNMATTLIVTGNVDFDGDLDVDGTTNLDVVDIDGAVNMATTLAVEGNVDFNGDLDVDGTIEFDAISGTGAVTVTNILDEDDMSSDSATALATQQSIKAYVDAQQDTVDTFGEVLALSNTTAGTDISVSTDDKVQFRDAAIYINSSVDGQLDIVADTEIQIAATTIDIDGAINASGEIIAASLDISGDVDVDGTTNLDVVDIDGAVNIATTALVTGVLTTTATQVATGGITSGSNIVSDTDSTDDLGTTSVRWANLFVDSITATDQITATGFTGTLDGILGSGAAAAATVTTLDTSGAVNLNLITDSSSSTSGALIVDGGVGIAKKLYVGTDLDVNGTTNLDVVDIDGAVQLDATLTIGANDQGYDVILYGDTASANVTWDTSADDLIFNGGAGLIVPDGQLTLASTAVTSTAAELNALDGITAVVGELNALDLGSTAVGTAIASKAVILDSNKDYTGVRNFSITGNLSVGGTTTVVDTVTMNAQNAVLFEGATADAHETTLTIVDPTADRTINLPNQSGTLPLLAAASNTAITSTPEELNILDGVTSTAAELNALDGITAVVGELNALDIGSTAVGTAVASKAVILDSNKDYTGIRNLTISGELDGGSLDISGDADIDGTTNLDIVDIDGAVDMASTLQVDGISTFTGQITANGGMELVDTKKLTFGTDDDLAIYHDGSNSYIDDVGTGNLFIRGANVVITTAGDTKYLEGGSNVLRLFHTGNERLRTSSAGVFVTGTVSAEGTSVFASLDISGDIDVDGTTNLDIVDIDGAVDMASTALVTGVLTTTATQVATGGITSGSDIISDTDSTDSLGSTAVRWLKGWFDTLTAGTLTIGSGSVTDSSGAISFGNENLSTTGTLDSGKLTVSGNIHQGTNPADAGDIRMAATSTIRNRNAANDDNITMVGTNGSDEVTIASSGGGTVVGGALDVTGITTGTGGFNVPNDVPIRGVPTSGGTVRMLRMNSSNVIEVGATSRAMDILASTATVSNHLDVTGGLRVSGEQATPLTNEGLYSGHASRGAYIQGHGSANDFTVANQAGTIAIAVPQNTIHVEARGNLTVSGKHNIVRGDITIASGAITPTTSYVRLDTQSAASSDDLDTINGGAVGDIIVATTKVSSRDVVVKDGTGNLQLAGGADFTLLTKSSVITFIYDGTSWLEISRSSN